MCPNWRSDRWEAEELRSPSWLVYWRELEKKNAIREKADNSISLLFAENHLQKKNKKDSVVLLPLDLF